MCDPELSALWSASVAFVTNGSSDASAFLEDTMTRLSHTVDVSPSSLLPRFLTAVAAEYHRGASSPALLLLAAILNRQFCLRAVPLACARPLNAGRPGDLLPLLRLYTFLLRDSSAPLPPAVFLQLLHAAAALLLLAGDDAAARLRAEAQSDAAFALFLADAAMALLSDRRVPIGPLRRSAQRVQLQRAAYLLLAPLPDECARAQWRAVARGAAFTARGVSCDARDAAPEFWAQLPAALCWRAALAAISNVSKDCADAEGAVCAALRNLSLVDGAAESLIISALEAAARAEGAGAVAPACRIVAAALEAAVEIAITARAQGDALYDAVANGVAVLYRALAGENSENSKSGESGESAQAEAACEGVSVLAQVLTPVHMPPMDETDDVEDYAHMAGETAAANARKAAALAQLGEFLYACRAALRGRLEAFTVSDASAAAEFALQRRSRSNGDSGHADVGPDAFAVRFDELPVAVFVSFERLDALLNTTAVGGSSGHVEAPNAYLDNCGIPCLAVLAASCGSSSSFAGCSDAAGEQERYYACAMCALSVCLSWCALDAATISAHAPFLPVIVYRFRDAWPPAERDRFAESIALALSAVAASARAWVSCVALADALAALPFSFSFVGAAPLAALWDAAQCCPAPDYRAALVARFAELLETSGAPLPPACAAAADSFEPAARAELFSCANADAHNNNNNNNNDNNNNVWRVMDALRQSDPDAAVCRRAAERVARRHAFLFSSSFAESEAAAAYAAAVRAFSLSSPLHFCATWRFAAALPAAAAAETIADALERRAAETRDGLANACAPLFVLETLAAAPPHAPRLLRLLRAALHGSADGDNFHNHNNNYNDNNNNGWGRLRTVAEGGERLRAHNFCDAAALAALFCDAAAECARLRQRRLRGAAECDDDEERNAERNAWEREEEEEEAGGMAALAKFGAVLREAPPPPHAPEWVKAMRGAVDEYELRRMLERA